MLSLITKRIPRIKVEAAEGQCRVNVKFWGGVIPGNAPHLKEMVSLGVPGFKCFLIHSGVDEFPAVSRDQVKRIKRNLNNNKVSTYNRHSD